MNITDDCQYNQEHDTIVKQKISKAIITKLIWFYKREKQD